MKKRFFALAAAVTLLTTGCSMFTDTSSTNQLKNYDFTQMELVQLEEPEEGQPMAIIKTTAGDMKVVLYPEYCPNTVQNFIDRANEGYYNNTSVFVVYSQYYFMAGSAAEDGTEGVTSDGNPIANECSVNLWPFKGALLAYNETEGYGDSRFMVLNTIEEFTEENKQQLRDIVDEDGNQMIPEELITAFTEVGVLPGFSGDFTVFGQTIEGLEVIEQIVAAPVDEETYVPLEDIIIESIEITEYHAE